MEPGISAYDPDYVSPPGETVIEVAAERGLSIADLASGLELPEEFIEALARGDEAITFALAQSLEKLLTVPAKFWLARENRYRSTRMR